MAWRLPLVILAFLCSWAVGGCSSPGTPLDTTATTRLPSTTESASDTTAESAVFPLIVGGPLAGHAQADDPADDLVPLYDPDAPAAQPAVADLRSVSLDSDGKVLTIRITAAAPLPQTLPLAGLSAGDVSSLRFEMTFWLSGGSGFQLLARCDSDGWTGFGAVSLPTPTVRGNVITIKVPIESIPDLARERQGFKWIADSEVTLEAGEAQNVGDDPSYGDRLPGRASHARSSDDPALPFPER